MKRVKVFSFTGVFAFFFFGINTSLPAQMRLEDGNKATCYSTFSAGCNSTIWRCGSCQSVRNADSYSDQGECRF
jgi:hypothetical protein